MSVATTTAASHSARNRAWRPCPCGGVASGECFMCHLDLVGDEDHYDDGDDLCCAGCLPTGVAP